MADPSCMYVIDQRDGVHVISFRRDMFDPLSIDVLRNDVRALIAASPAGRIVVDCGNLRQVSSVFLGVLLEISLKLRGQKGGGGLRVCGMTPQVREVFGVMRLDHAVRIVPTLDEALATFGAV